jgi:hypothetical protein
MSTSFPTNDRNDERRQIKNFLQDYVRTEEVDQATKRMILKKEGFHFV